VALGVAAQFEFTIRQIDVIGEWERVEPVKELATDAIVSNAQVWRPDLRFEDFAAGELDLETSKTQAKAIFDVTAYPLFQQALSAVPEGQRRGPLVTDDSGMPVRRRYYQDLYRDVADAAGVPRAVWNMLARHGGATEARQAGVALADIAEHAQHADLNTTRKHYIVPSVETSRRVAKQRVAHRQAKKNTP
jgi:integrase